MAICAITTIFANVPEKDAVYKLISESYTLNNDGSTEIRKRKELKLITRMTFDEFGETFITYNPDFQELIINEAYTIRKDGSKVETPANAFNPMLPENCTKCERLNGIRTMVVTHTALEYDAVIVLDYTIRSKNFFFQELMEKVDLQEEVPVEKYVVSVSQEHISGGKSNKDRPILQEALSFCLENHIDIILVSELSRCTFFHCKNLPRRS